MIPMEVCDVNTTETLIDGYRYQNNLIHDFLEAEDPVELIITLPSSLIIDAIKFFHSIANKINSGLVSKIQNLQLLTLFSLSMGTTDVRKYLNVSEHSIKQQQDLLRQNGILSVPKKERGKELPERIVDCIIKFYQRDHISSVRPGIRDVVKVKQKDGTTVELKKRLLHWNLKEVYELLKLDLKEKHDLNFHVGLTKFILLRQKNILLVGATGKHLAFPVTKYY